MLFSRLLSLQSIRYHRCWLIQSIVITQSNQSGVIDVILKGCYHSIQSIRCHRCYPQRLIQSIVITQSNQSGVIDVILKGCYHAIQSIRCHRCYPQRLLSRCHPQQGCLLFTCHPLAQILFTKIEVGCLGNRSVTVA